MPLKGSLCSRSGAARGGAVTGVTGAHRPVPVPVLCPHPEDAPGSLSGGCGDPQRVCAMAGASPAPSRGSESIGSGKSSQRIPAEHPRVMLSPGQHVPCVLQISPHPLAPTTRLSVALAAPREGARGK